MSLKEIRRRITSVNNTKQITRAMKLVSAAKLRRAQEAAEGGRSFGGRLAELLETVSADLPVGATHPLLEKRPSVAKRCLIVIAGERGLCGAFNTNVIKKVTAELLSSSSPVDVVVVGKRAVGAAKRFGWNIVREYEALPDSVAQWPTSEMAEFVMNGFCAGDYDEVSIVFTEFVSAMTQKVKTQALLPFTATSAAKGNIAESDVSLDSQEVTSGRTKYDPAPLAILHGLLPLLVKTQVCQAAFESKASEHGARMSAMDSATRNADELSDKLRLYYNRARQSAITTELIDVIGGAEAAQG